MFCWNVKNGTSITDVTRRSLGNGQKSKIQWPFVLKCLYKIKKPDIALEL